MHAGALRLLHAAALPERPGTSPRWQNQLGLLHESTGEGIFGIDLGGHYPPWGTA